MGSDVTKHPQLKADNRCGGFGPQVRLLVGFTFGPNSASVSVSTQAGGSGASHHGQLRDVASVSPGCLSVSASASVSAARLKADTFYSTAAAAAHAQTQARAALHLGFNRLFTAATKPRPQRGKPRPSPDQTPSSCAFPGKVLRETSSSLFHTFRTSIQHHIQQGALSHLYIQI